MPITNVTRMRKASTEELFADRLFWWDELASIDPTWEPKIRQARRARARGRIRQIETILVARGVITPDLKVL